MRTIVIGSNAKLDYQIGYLVIRTCDARKKIHLSEIDTLVIESTAVSLTAYLVNMLIENKTKIIFCNEKRNPSAEVIPVHGCHDCSRKLREQIAWQEDTMSLVWMHITEQKIINQSRILNANGHNEESKMLYEYSKNVTPGDKSNREGHAAKVYFNTLFGKDFCRSDDNQINACLNYGYSIILSAFNRELCNLGYVTELGIFHNNIRNPFNLACDLMEPFRQVVDKFVVQNSPVTLTTETKHELVKLLDEEVEINGRKEYLQRAIQIYTKSITDALTLNDVSIIKFYNYEW